MTILLTSSTWLILGIACAISTIILTGIGLIIKSTIKKATTLEEDRYGNLYPLGYWDYEQSFMQIKNDGFIKIKSLKRCLNERIIEHSQHGYQSTRYTSVGKIIIPNDLVSLLGKVQDINMEGMYGLYHDRNYDIIAINERPFVGYWILPIEFVEY